MLMEIIQKFAETKTTGLPLLLIAALKMTRDSNIKENASDYSDDIPGDNFPYISIR